MPSTLVYLGLLVSLFLFLSIATRRSVFHTISQKSASAPERLLSVIPNQQHYHSSISITLCFLFTSISNFSSHDPYDTQTTKKTPKQEEDKRGFSWILFAGAGTAKPFFGGWRTRDSLRTTFSSCSGQKKNRFPYTTPRFPLLLAEDRKSEQFLLFQTDRQMIHRQREQEIDNETIKCHQKRSYAPVLWLTYMMLFTDLRVIEVTALLVSPKGKCMRMSLLRAVGRG